MTRSVDVAHEHLTWDSLEGFFLRTERPEERLALFHLLSICEPCRTACEPLLELYHEGEVSALVTWAELQAAAGQWRAADVWKEIERERLAGVDSAEEALERLRDDGRWPGWGLVAFLARSAEEMVEDQPTEALYRAKLAAHGAGRLSGKVPMGEDWLAELHAYALAVLGHAWRRVRGRTERAARAFELARERLEAVEHPADFLPFRPRLDELEAELCLEQERFYEARRLFGRALRAWQESVPKRSRDVERLRRKCEQVQEDVDILIAEVDSKWLPLRGVG